MNADSFELFKVTKRKKGFTVGQFLDEKKVNYWKGCVFYEMIKPEYVSDTSNIALITIKTDQLFDGEEARRILKLNFDKLSKNEKLELNPNKFNKYRIFISFRSNKKLLTSVSELLYKFKPNEVIAKDAPAKKVKQLKETISKNTLTKKSKSVKKTISKKKTGVKKATLKKKTPEKTTPVKKIPERRSSARRRLFTEITKVATKRSTTDLELDGDEDDVEPKTKRIRATSKSRKEPKITTATTTHLHVPRASSGDCNAIQIVFSYDTTGSMSGCIEQVKQLISGTISRLMNTIPNIEIAVIAHGDYYDENSSYLLKFMDFTRDERQLCNFITNVGHTCGGDFEEAYEYVLNKVRTSLSWNENASKSLVLVGDAIPHAPNDMANKSKLDWREEAKALYEKKIKVYAVKCLGWPESTHFFKELASITSGFYLELHQFTAITDFMIAISLRENNLDQLFQFRQEVQDRNQGTLNRNMRQLFATLAGEEPGDDSSLSDLTAVTPGRFQILNVDRNDSIKNFVIRNGAKFKIGKGFYEYTKGEEVQWKKEIVLMDRKTGDMFTGDRARQLVDIADHVKGKKMKPPSSDKYIIFIQSTSHNRKLIAGTKFLYEASKDPID